MSYARDYIYIWGSKTGVTCTGDHNPPLFDSPSYFSEVRDSTDPLDVRWWAVEDRWGVPRRRDCPYYTKSRTGMLRHLGKHLRVARRTVNEIKEAMVLLARDKELKGDAVVVLKGEEDE